MNTEPHMHPSTIRMIAAVQALEKTVAEVNARRQAREDVAKLTAKVAAAVRKDPTLTERIEAVISKSTRRQLAGVT